MTKYTMPPVRQYGDFIRQIQTLMSQILCQYDIEINQYEGGDYFTVNKRRLLWPDNPTGEQHAGEEPYWFGEYESYSTYIEALKVALEQMEYNIALEVERD